MSAISRLLFGGCFGIEPEQKAPAVGRIDRFAHGLRTIADPLEMAVLEIDAGSRPVGCEGDLDLGDQVGIVGPVGSQLPCEKDPRRRVPLQDLADLALGAIGAELVPASAGARLDDGFIEIASSDFVRLGPPAADARGEHFERVSLRRINENGFAHGRGTDLRAHSFSFFSARSASAANALSASLQNWSSQARSAPRPFGSIW